MPRRENFYDYFSPLLISQKVRFPHAMMSDYRRIDISGAAHDAGRSFLRSLRRKMMRHGARYFAAISLLVASIKISCSARAAARKAGAIIAADERARQPARRCAPADCFFSSSRHISWARSRRRADIFQFSRMSADLLLQNYFRRAINAA